VLKEVQAARAKQAGPGAAQTAQAPPAAGSSTTGTEQAKAEPKETGSRFSLRGLFGGKKPEQPAPAQRPRVDLR